MREYKMEFSKKIILFVTILNLVVIGFALVMMWRTEDLSPLAYLIPAVATEASVGTAFYYNKAKTENRIKLMRHYNIKLDKEDFREE